MKFVKTLIAVAVTACAVNANAGLSFSQMSAVGYSGGPLIGLVAITSPVTINTTGSVAGVRLTPSPLTQTDPYTVISANGAGNGKAKLTFANAVSSFSFLWGSPDNYNFLEIMGSDSALPYLFNGTQLGVLGGFTSNGNNANTRVFTITGNEGTMINSITFRSEGIAFEIASNLAPIPEPETYALMLAGLGAVGFMARRRRVQASV